LVWQFTIADVSISSIMNVNDFTIAIYHSVYVIACFTQEKE